MNRKLRRSRRSVFRRRTLNPVAKTALTILVCAAVVAAGFFSAKLISERPKTVPTTAKSHSGSSADKKPNRTPGKPQNSPAVDPSIDTSVAKGIRAFYLPTSELSVDSLTDTSTFADAKAAGFTAVVFDLKDADGNLHYQFANAQAKRVGYDPNALTKDNLTALFSLIREAGLHPIPRLYAFRDDVASKVLTDARITLVGNPSWAWYDGDRNNGGKKWLSPYSATAQHYIQDLAKELQEAGAAAVMLDGVQFPNKLDSNADLGQKPTTNDPNDNVLASFLRDTRTLLGADCPLLVGCTAENDVTNAKLYGGNPLTLGAAVSAPMLSSKVEESVKKLLLRTQVLEDAPLLAPMLSAKGLSADKVNELLAACVKGGAKDFILFLPDGQYAFAEYTLP